MKKAYEAPSAVLVGFEPGEALTNIIDFDDLLNLSGSGEAVVPSGGDINIGT